MPSQVLQELIQELRDGQKASAGQSLPLGELRATFASGGRMHPVPDDVLVTEVKARGVVATRDAREAVPTAPC